MHLLRISDAGEITLTTGWTDDRIPPYAILSHTWGSETEEVTFQDIQDGTGVAKLGYRKLNFCGKQAKEDSLDYFWVDTCCIDKTNQNELSEAINSMFRWYTNASQCYVYLSDVSWPAAGDFLGRQRATWKTEFAKAKWFTRGWTLQELLAPQSVIFFSKEEQKLGTKASLLEWISETTKIPPSALRGRPLSEYGINERISWSYGRQTSRKEDIAYSLLGICQVFMPPIYGEGQDSAFRRLNNEIRQNDKRQDILQWICPTDFQQQQTDTFRRHQGGTGRWFLECEEFRNWINGTRHTLFCPGSPGAGKTVMVSTVIDYMMREVYSSETPILYLYCSYKRQTEEHFGYLLAALLRQLLYATTAIPQFVKNLYEYHTARNTRLSNEELQEIFIKLCPGFSKVYVIIDGLDECERKVCRQMAASLRMLREIGAIQTLVTSRFVPEVHMDIKPDSVREIQAVEIDIEVYLRCRIPELSTKVRNDKALQENILTTVAGAAKGMFLLAQLYMDSLTHKRSVTAVRNALKKLPSGDDAYNFVYEDALSRISSQVQGDREIALNTIAWITCACRPLKGVELQHALAVEEKSNGLDLDNIVDMGEILSLCAGLVVYDAGTTIVRLIHYTAQEFFERTWTKWNPDAEAKLALKCVSYLSFARFRRGPCISLENLQGRYAVYAFYNYSGKFWGYHTLNVELFKRASNHCLDTLRVASLALLNDSKLLNSSTQVLLAEPFEWPLRLSLEGEQASLMPLKSTMPSLYRSGTHGIHVAARLGLKWQLEQLINAEPYNVNLQDHAGRTPLSLAALHGHGPVLRQLLKTSDVRVEVKDNDGCTPLWLAARNGYEWIVEALLETGRVDVDAKDKHGGTPLYVAVGNGHAHVVRLLQETGQADMKWENSNGHTLLTIAAREGHDKVVENLLATGMFDINSSDEKGWTALTWAVRHSHERVVSALVATEQIDINPKDDKRRTPLFFAVEYGNETIVKTLLETGLTDINSLDITGQTPLSRAVFGHSPAIFKMLVETGQIDVDSMDGFTAIKLFGVAVSKALKRLGKRYARHVRSMSNRRNGTHEININRTAT